MTPSRERRSGEDRRKGLLDDAYYAWRESDAEMSQDLRERVGEPRAWAWGCRECSAGGLDNYERVHCHNEDCPPEKLRVVPLYALTEEPTR